MEKLLKSNLLLGIILIVAAVLRLYRIADYMTFLGDEGRDVLVVYNILHGHFTLLGPTSSVGGFFLGPIYYYIMAPFLLLFNYNPVGPAVMVAFFGIATVWFVYKIGENFFSKTAGLIASFLFAISPLVIAYSRSSWNPNIMPFFTLLTLYVLYKAIQNGKMKYFILCGFFLGILIQLHYLATFVGAIIFFYILGVHIYFKKQDQQTWQTLLQHIFGEYFQIFIGFLLGVSPFLAFEARHGFPNTRSIIKFIFTSKEVTGGGNFFIIIQNVFFRLFGRLVTDFPPPEQVSVAAHQNIFIWYVLTWLLALASLGYFLVQFVRTIKNSYHSDNDDDTNAFLQFALLFCWFVLGIIFFGFYKKQIYDYYFGFLFPVPFLLVSNFWYWLWKQKIVGKLLATVLFIALAYINLQAIPFRYQPNRQLNQAQTIAKFVMDKTNGKPYNFALITAGNSDQEYRYFFTVWNHPPTTLIDPITDPQRKSVTDQLLVVCDTLPCHPLGNPLWEVAGFGRAIIVGQWNVSVVQVFKLLHYTGNGQ